MFFPLLERLSRNLLLFLYNDGQCCCSLNWEMHHSWLGGKRTRLGASGLLHAGVVKKIH